MQALPQLLWLRSLTSIIDFSPLTVEPETSLSDAISLMAKWGVGVLVVSVSKLVGWLTEQDVVRLLASEVDFKTTQISEVMQPVAIALKLSDLNNLTTVLSLMHKYQLDLLPIVDEQGQLIGTVTPESICRSLEQLSADGIKEICDRLYENINEYQQAQDALEKSEERFRFLAESIPQQVWIAKANGNIEYVNKRTVDYFGCSFEDIFDWPWQQWIHPEDLPKTVVSWQQSLAIGEPLEIEVRWQRGSDKTYRWHLIRALPLCDRQGNILNWFGTNTDIDDRVSAEIALRESEWRFRLLLEGVKDYAIYLLDPQGRVMSWNSGAECITGYQEREIIGENFSCFFPPEDIAKAIPTQQLNIAVAQGRYEYEGMFVRKDGSHFWANCILTALRDHTGNLRGFSKVTRNITESKLAQDSLLRFHKAIESTSDAIVIDDITGTNIYLNPAFVELYGYTLEELQVAGGFRVIFQQPVEPEKIFITIQNGKSWRGEVTMRSRNGRIMQVYLSIDAIKDAMGKIIGTVCIHTDITQRRQAETALLVSQQRLQYLLSSSPAVIYTAKTSLDFSGTFISENVSTVLGYEAWEMIENPHFWISRIHPEDLPHVQTDLSKIGEQGQYKLEYRFLHKDGTYRWLYDQGKLVRDETGNPLELVGYMAEITDRKQLEHELRVALEKEKELNELKSRFVSMTSHEFRTPLSTILSSSELLEHYRYKWSEEKQLTHLHRIQTAVKRMTEMLNDVLIIGKVEAGKLEFKPKSFDLVAYCRHLVEETQLNLSNQQVIDFINQHESILCCMDDKLLRHILGNLLSNASKYSPTNSTIKFTLTCQHGQAVFAIQDYGIGIPPEDLPHLFESFYRANNVGNILGTGLGLAIVKSCVDIHQGEIFVTSILEKGTLFTVILPLNN